MIDVVWVDVDWRVLDTIRHSIDLLNTQYIINAVNCSLECCVWIENFANCKKQYPTVCARPSIHAQLNDNLLRMQIFLMSIKRMGTFSMQKQTLNWRWENYRENRWSFIENWMKIGIAPVLTKNSLTVKWVTIFSQLQLQNQQTISSRSWANSSQLLFYIRTN